MIRLAFKLNSFFWMVSPACFLVGRALGVWDFKFDIGIFLGLMFMMGVSAFLNYSPDEPNR